MLNFRNNYSDLTKIFNFAIVMIHCIYYFAQDSFLYQMIILIQLYLALTAIRLAFAYKKDRVSYIIFFIYESVSLYLLMKKGL